jgi:hypothetical protein
VEWEENVRQAFFREHGVGLETHLATPPGQRVGLLARVDEEAQRIVIDVCWSRPDQEQTDLQVELSPVSIELDLSARASQEASPSTPACVRLAVEDDLANALLARMSFHIRPEWRAYYAEFGGADDQAIENAQNVALDANMLMAVALLLAAREPLRGVAVSRSQLNAARLRRGRPALLDHVELTMPLAAADVEVEESPHDAHRSAARLHMVRAHLVRRGASIFWRRAHLRGHAERGQIATRTVSLRGA